jgi:hypothetical protein
VLANTVFTVVNSLGCLIPTVIQNEESTHVTDCLVDGAIIGGITRGGTLVTVGDIVRGMDKDMVVAVGIARRDMGTVEIIITEGIAHPGKRRRL